MRVSGQNGEEEAGKYNQANERAGSGEEGTRLRGFSNVMFPLLTSD